MYKFITLSNGKKVQAFYEADESQVTKIAGSQFDFKELTDGNTAQKIAFVDADGNKVNVLFFGPELVTNGDFTTDTDWTKGTGVTIAGGKATYIAGSTFPGLQQTLPSVIGKYVLISIDVVNYTSGDLATTFGSSGPTVNFGVTGIGTYIIKQIWNGVDSILYLRGDATLFIGSIDNVSVKEIL